MGEGALSGLTVLEWCGGTPAAYCGKLLSDLGADVVKIETPEGDPTRRQLLPSPPGSAGARFLYLATGKQSVIFDGGPQSSARVRSLLSAADVVLTDEAAGIEPSGIALPRDLSPAAIWCSVTPFGLTGPYAGRKGTHLTIFHSGGEGHILPSGAGWEQYPERPPLQIGSETGLFDAGANAAVAVLGCVLRQRRAGQGEHIDISAQESQLTLNRTRLSRYANDGIELRRDRSRYGVGGMLACADGRVQLVGVREEHWRRLPESSEGMALVEAVGRHGELGDPEAQSAGLAEWCRQRPKAAVVSVLSAAGCPVGPYCTPDDLVADRQLVHRRFFQEVPTEYGMLSMPGAPYRFSVTEVRLRPPPALGSGEGFRRDLSASPGPRVRAQGSWPPAGPDIPGRAGQPLAGVRVVDFTWAAAGPYATLLLGFLGADVIKVETRRRPDPARRGFLADYGGPERSPNFNELNLGKRGLEINLGHPVGLALVRRLISVSDVVVDNFRPGVMARFGLDAASLLAEHPSLVVASSSANGSTGPDALGAGLASIFGASGGLSEQTGYPDGPPTEIGESTDYRSANALAVAILSALVHRQRTGEGQSIDLSSREVVIATSPDGVLARALGIGRPLRNGNTSDGCSPHGLFPCRGADEWIAVAVTAAPEWEALCALLGQPEWPDAFPGPGARRAAGATISGAVASWTKRRSAAEAFEALQRCGVPAAPSFTNKELVLDPHLAARKVFMQVEHPVIGAQTVMRAPWIMSSAGGPPARHGPLLGQDNRAVIEGLLQAEWPPDAAEEVFG